MRIAWASSLILVSLYNEQMDATKWPGAMDTTSLTKLPAALMLDSKYHVSYHDFQLTAAQQQIVGEAVRQDMAPVREPDEENQMAEKYLLKDRTAIVTGAGAGIGRAVAMEFAREGAKVMIAELREEKGAEAAAEIAKATGGDVHAVRTDVRSEEDIKHVVAETVAVFGSVDILVNNAAKILQRPLVEMTTDEFEGIMRNNSTSVMMCCREAGRQMIKQGTGGVIVNFSSIHAMISEPNCSAYTAAKGAIEALSRTLATELAPHKIRVNCIEPGATYSELTTPMYTESVVKALFERVPMKEIAQPEWIARGVVFLASNESRYMTGEVIVMDGGYRMDGSLPGAAYWQD